MGHFSILHDRENDRWQRSKKGESQWTHPCLMLQIGSIGLLER